MNEDSTTSPPPSPLPADDHKRNLTLARPESDQSLSHIGLAGDTYTILLSGGDTNGRYCLIDMFIPPGGGPAPIDMISKNRSRWFKARSKRPSAGKGQ